MSSQVENDLFETSIIEQNKNKHLRLNPEAKVQPDLNTFSLPIKATHISVFNESVHFLGPGLSTSVIACPYFNDQVSHKNSSKNIVPLWHTLVDSWLSSNSLFVHKGAKNCPPYDIQAPSHGTAQWEPFKHQNEQVLKHSSQKLITQNSIKLKPI